MNFRYFSYPFKMASLLLAILVFLLNVTSVASYVEQDCTWTKDGNGYWISDCPYGSLPAITTVIDQNANEAPDFLGDTWLFDANGDGSTNLVIAFSKVQNKVEAKFFDDQNSDGTVSYDLRNGQPGIAESEYPVVRVTATDGWWVKAGKTNFNLDIAIDGPVRGTFSYPELSQIKNDGEVDFSIQVRDQDHDGRPDYDIRQVLYPWEGMQTSLVVNTAGNERPIEGSIFWPFLGNPADVVKRVGESPAPIMMDWKTSKIVAVGEFVASRANDGNWFIYSHEPIGRDENTYANFENPFAFYDLANDRDGQPELAVRNQYSGAYDLLFDDGSFPEPVNMIRYSWDQDNNGSWDFSLNLLGRNPITTQVELPGIMVQTIPYSTFPEWVIGQKWDTAAFTVDEIGSSRSSEGIYEGFSSYLYENYFTGYGEDRELVLEELQDIRAGLRQEVNPDLMKQQISLYISPIDGKIHLFRALEGMWKLSDTGHIEYIDLDNNGFLDSWELVSAGTNGTEEIQQSLYLSKGILIYADKGQVMARQVGIHDITELLSPPTDNASWQALGQKLDAARIEASGEDFAALFNHQGTAQWQVSGASLSDFRSQTGGFRFVLDLKENYAVEGQGGPDLNALMPGKYVVTYNGVYSVQRYSDAKPTIFFQLPDQTPSAAMLPVAIRLENGGNVDYQNVRIIVEARSEETALPLMEMPVNLLAGQPVSLEASWQPMRPGSWQISILLKDKHGATLNSAVKSVEVKESDFASILSVALTTNPGKSALSLLLLLAGGVFITLLFRAAWVSGKDDR